MIDHETGEPSAASGSPSGPPGPPPAVSRGADPGGDLEDQPIGEYLRRQRMLRGMTAEELATLTRIPLRSLERLEGGQFDGETDGFVRGFVRTVAAALGLDADDALARMLQEPSAGSWERRAASDRVKRGVATVVLVVAALLLFLVVRAGWNVLRGVTAAPASQEVVLWQDPVRALAEATGARLDPAGEIAPSLPDDPARAGQPALRSITPLETGGRGRVGPRAAFVSAEASPTASPASAGGGP